MYKEPVEVSEKITVVKEVPKEITGGMKADTLLTKENSYPVDGVFILRESVSPKNLVPGLQMDGNHVAVNLQMETNVPGCFACGDIAGRPLSVYQVRGAGKYCGTVSGFFSGSEAPLRSFIKSSQFSD